MTILNIQLGQVGLVGVEPRNDYILTNNTVAQVLITGYLNSYVDSGFQFNQGDIVSVITQETSSARKMASLYQVDHVSEDWSLIPLKSSMLLYAAQYTTSGGAAAEAITITGLTTDDLAYIQMVDNGTNTVTVISSVVTTDTLTVTFSGDPADDTIINYQILRP